MNGRMVDASRFAMTPRSDIPRSSFSIEHTHKTTFGAGYLIPVFVDEVLPGDSWRLDMTAFGRLSTPIVPVMDNLVLESHFFYCPTRLLWTHWVNFMGEQAAPNDTTQYLTPQVSLTQVQCSVGTLPDYMGITLNAAGPISVLAFPFRAYNKIWNEFFRDQDLQTKVVENVGDGPDAATDYVLLNRGKRHDYFTSARPWPEKNTAVGNQNTGTLGPTVQGQNYSFPSSGIPLTGLAVSATAVAPTSGTANVMETGNRALAYSTWYDTALVPFYMRVHGGTQVPNVRVLVNDIRTGIMVQNYLEQLARGGSRYTEMVRSLFGVVSPDARLQRPEYLGGGRSFIEVNPVTQTTPTGIAGTTTKFGEQAGVGTVRAVRHGFSQSFTEHGYIIGLVSVRSDLTYQQGIERFWHRRSLFDYYSPPMAHLGEQAIQRKEIYATGVAAEDTTVFGYQERWAEYKYKPSRTSGYFRSTVATPLDMWHFGQKFASAPVLNSAFVVDVAPMTRVLQVTGNFGAQFLMDTMFSVRKTSAMPMYSIPGVGARL